MKPFPTVWPTLWVLQPLAVLVVQVAALKLLLTVIGDGHRDKWIHSVKALLGSKTQQRMGRWEVNVLGSLDGAHASRFYLFIICKGASLKNH